LKGYFRKKKRVFRPSLNALRCCGLLESTLTDKNI